MDPVTTDEMHAMLINLNKDFRSAIPMHQKQFKLQAFCNYVQETVPSQSSEYVDDLIESIEPTDFSSKRLKLELANRFKRPLVILEYIKTEEKFLVKRALKFSWIYEAGNSPFTNPKTLVRIILPAVSYSTRLRIISGLSKNLQDEKVAQEMFLLVQEKYGTFCALELLPSCTKEFIRDCLKSNEFFRTRLTGKQVLNIARKDHAIVIDLVTYILEYLPSSNIDILSSSTENKPLTNEDKLQGHLKNVLQKVGPYLCINHPQDFVKLYQKYPGSLRLENKPKPKVTKALLTSCKATVIANATVFKGILNPRYVFVCLKWEEFVTFLKSLLPRQQEYFIIKSKSMQRWIDPLPFQKRWEAISQAFLQKYGGALESYPDCLSPTILRLAPSETRNKIAGQKLKNGDPCPSPTTTTSSFLDSLPQHSEGYWYSFMSLDKSVVKLKELLATESNGDIRGELLTYLVVTCSINGKNKKEMLELCKFVLSKYRNDSSEVREEFLEALGEEFNLHKWMNEDLWKVLIEFIKLTEICEDEIPECLIQPTLRYHLLNDLPTVDTLLNEFVETQVSSSYGLTTEWNWFNSEPELEEKFLRLTLEEMTKMYPADVVLISKYYKHPTLPIAIINLLKTIAGWKERNRKIASRLSIATSTWLATRITEMTKTSFPNKHEHIHDVHLELFQAIRSDHEIMSSCLKSFIDHCPIAPLLEYSLYYYPATVKASLKKRIIPFMLDLEEEEGMLKTYKGFFKSLKQFTEMASSVVEICLEVAQDDHENRDRRLNALIILSHLWVSSNFLNIVSLFYPLKPISDLTEDDSEFESNFEVKKSLVQSLTNTSNPAACLEVLEKFLVGDYTEVSVGALYSSCLLSPQQIATKFLTEALLHKPVSVKKHAIKLLCLISEKEEVEELLTYMWENEGQSSLKEVLVSKILHFLTNNPSEATWKKGEAFLQSLSNSMDKCVLQELFSSHHIEGLMKDKVLVYLTICHRVLTKEAHLSSWNKGDFKIDLLQHLIQKLGRNIQALSDTALVESLINHYLFVPDLPERISAAIVALAVSFLLTLENDYIKSSEVCLAHNKLEVIMSTISKLKSQWNQDNTVGVTDGVTASTGTRFGRKALNLFVVEVCKGVIEKIKDCPNSKGIYRQFCSNFLKRIEIDLEGSAVFTEVLFLKVLLMLLEDSSAGLEEHTEAQRCLFNVGLKLHKLTDLIVKVYHSAVFGLYFDKLSAFFKEIYGMDFSKDHDVIFLVLGIVSEAEESMVSIENQILACKLLPGSPPRNPELHTKYIELLRVISKFDSNTAKAFLNDKYVYL